MLSGIAEYVVAKKQKTIAIPALTAQSVPDAAGKASPTLPASPSRSRQNQTSAPPCIPQLKKNSNTATCDANQHPPAPPPAKPVPPPAHTPEQGGSTSPPHQSHAPLAVRPRRSTKPHPTAKVCPEIPTFRMWFKLKLLDPVTGIPDRQSSSHITWPPKKHRGSQGSSPHVLGALSYDSSKAATTSP